MPDSADLVDLVRDSIHERDEADGTIRLWNAGAETLYGWSKAEALGKVAHALLRTEFPRPLAEIESEIVRTGRWEGELVHTHRDGSRVVVASRWGLRRDARGKPRAHLVLETDLTDRRLAADARGQLRRECHARWVAEQAIERLQRWQALMAALAGVDTPLEVARTLVQRGLQVLGAGAGGVFVLRDDGLTLENLFAVGYPRDILAAWQRIPLATPVPAAEAIRTREPVWIRSTAAATRYPQLMETLDRIGSQAMAALPLLVGARAIGTLILTFEEERRFGIEERRLATVVAGQVAAALDRACRFASVQLAAAQAVEALRRRDELLVTATHDLKVPITAIKMTAQLLSHRLAAGNLVEARVVVEEMGRIDAAVTRTGALVDEILALTTPGLKRPPALMKTAVDLVMLVRRVVIEATSGEPATRMVIHAEPEPLVGRWDSAQLERAFANLLDNALKYSPRQSVVEVRLTQERTRHTRWAVVHIKDEGVGIPGADLGRVFHRFQRGDNVVGRIPGTGVGLSSVREIVEQHGGSVEVHSQEGRSSTFSVRLPLPETH